MAIFNPEDSINTIVIECTEISIKIGFAGCYMPDRIVNNFILKCNKKEATKDKDFITLPDVSEISSRYYEYDYQKLLQGSKILDMSIFKDFLLRTIQDSFSISPEDLKEYCIFFVNRNTDDEDMHKQIIDLFLEDIGVKSIFIKDSGCCSLFSSGKTSGFVADFGNSSTIMTPVENGNVFNGKTFKSPLAMDLLVHQAHKVFLSLGVDILSFQRPSFESNFSNGGKIKEINESIELHNRSVKYSEFIIEALSVAPSSLKESVDNNILIPVIHHKFSNSSDPVKLDLSRYHITECFFSTDSIISSHEFKLSSPFELQNIDVSKFQPIQNFLSDNFHVIAGQMSFASQGKLSNRYNPADCNDLISNLVCVGDCTFIDNFKSRLVGELSNYFHQKNPHGSKIPYNSSTITQGCINPPNSQINVSRIEAQHSSWIGASIIASLPEFKNLVWTKEGIEEGAIVRDHLKIL